MAKITEIRSHVQSVLKKIEEMHQPTEQQLVHEFGGDDIKFLEKLLGLPVEREVKTQSGSKSNKVDFAVGKGKNRWLLEFKRPNETLNPHARQLSTYLKDLDCHYGILFNGREACLVQANKGEVLHAHTLPEVARLLDCLCASKNLSDRVKRLELVKKQKDKQSKLQTQKDAKQAQRVLTWLSNGSPKIVDVLSKLETLPQGIDSSDIRRALRSMKLSSSSSDNRTDQK